MLKDNRGVFRGAEKRWNRGLGDENLDATGIRSVHIGVDSSGLLLVGERADRFLIWAGQTPAVRQEGQRGQGKTLISGPKS